MTAPLYEALQKYIARRRERLHMPGHKGVLPYPLTECAPFDVTELVDTGCLYDGEGAPVETENAFCKLYQSGASLLSTGGSTLCIQTMLSLFCPDGSRVLMTRGAHHAAVNASALLNLYPDWLLPDEAAGALIPGRISPEAVKRALESEEKYSAVYITSPDYFGTRCDIRLIADICHRHDTPLLVDNAHGAHLKFFQSMHPMELGADACCDSLHKTLPALTGAALLHLKDGALKDEARRRMKHFGSTSPSYLTMLSCDMLLPRWNELASGYIALAERVSRLALSARKRGVWAADESPLRDPARIPLLLPENMRESAENWLVSCGIEPEYLSPRHIVLIPSAQNDLSAVEKLIALLPEQNEPVSLPELILPRRVMTLREAALRRAKKTPLENAVGLISAAPAAPCPPGVAVVMPGEIITRQAADMLAAYGIKELFTL